LSDSKAVVGCGEQAFESGSYGNEYQPHQSLRRFSSG